MTERARSFRRVPEKGILAGVCAGIAAYADVDITVVRAFYVAGTLVTFVLPGLLAYLVLWAVVPPARTEATPAG